MFVVWFRWADLCPVVLGGTLVVLQRAYRSALRCVTVRCVAFRCGVTRRVTVLSPRAMPFQPLT